jgi:integrase
MALRMARPTRIKSSSSVYFRERIPSDVLAKAKGMAFALPVGDELAHVTVGPNAATIKVSLRTSDDRLAKDRQRQVGAYLSRCWESLRKGPARLTHKETVALSGEVYKAFTEALGDDPCTPAMWDGVRQANADARSGQYGSASLMIGRENRIQASLEQRFGGFADAMLTKHGLHVDADSRKRLIEQVGKAADLAAGRLRENADGNYSADPNADRFGVWQPPKEGEPSLDWSSLLAGWRREAQPKLATADQWTGYIADLASASGVNAPAELRRSDVVRWKDALLDRGDAVKTINDSKLAALKAILNWAVANGRLEANVAQGVSVRQKKKPGQRMNGFSDEQAQAILSAVVGSSLPARRWVPLICAGSGARVAEIAQLRRKDIKLADGIAYMSITADAGSVKNEASERIVPLHPQVLAAGFLAFVDSAPDGPLFYDPQRRNPDAKKPAAKIVAKNLAAWVGTLAPGINSGCKVYH